MLFREDDEFKVSMLNGNSYCIKWININVGG